MIETQFVTFYSYKGGVGRTLALGNIAWEAALRGKKVVVIDFDLEAPGMPSLNPFRDPIKNHLNDKNKMGGLFELILYFKEHQIIPSIPDFYTAEPIIDNDFDNGGEIYIVPAGYENFEYKDKLQSFDWDRFYEQENGSELFKGLRDAIKFQFDDPDLVLIDSRTGLTDIGGICTLLIPDKVVVLTGLNEQNLNGCKSVIDTIEEHSGYRQETNYLHPIEIILVASHVPDGEEIDLFHERLKKAETIFGRQIDVVFPYVAALSLEERLLIHEQGKVRKHSMTLVERYRKLYSFIVDTGVSAEIRSYCQEIENLHTNLPVAGFATRLSVPIDVEDIYISLRAVVDLKAIAEDRFSDASHAKKMLRESEAALEISLPEAFRESEKRNKRGMIILGEPGSGKTTHLKRLLLWCLRNGPETIGLPHGMLPVFLPLRDLDDLDSGLDRFIQDQLTSPHLKTPEGFGERLIERGNLLFLLDGLDEVADLSRREKVTQWIVDVFPCHPTCRFVVTCRFAGYSPTVRLSEKFIEMHVRPFAEDQAEQFVRKWYGIVEKGLARDTEQAGSIAAEKSRALIERLREPDFRARRVFELTRNPLLLTNICLIHRHRGTLPLKRARLYEECIDVLLEHWRGAKGLSVRVTAQDGRRILQPAALWLHGEEGRTLASSDELAPHIEPVLKALNWSGGGTKEFLSTIKNESGLLTAYDQEYYGFVHLGFQEYLAAREIRTRAFEDPGVLRELAARFGESWWQEVGLLLLALEDPSLFIPYMREVVKQPAFAKFPSLVEACLDDSAEISAMPFLELLEISDSNDPSLRERQLAAIKIVARLDPEALDKLRPQLQNHPFEPIRQWVKERVREAVQDVVISDRGNYELVRIPAGKFMMGSPKAEEGRYEDEGPVHEVRVQEFYIGRYPVTNREYGLFMENNQDVSEPKSWMENNQDVSEPKSWADRRFNQPSQPVVGVSWDDANRYASWAGLRLSTEAEWEYACRGGSQTRFYSGDTEHDLERTGWYKNNSGNQTHPVGEKEANEFVLYDMHGNVWEWTEDDWHNDYNGAPDDGSAWVENPRFGGRVARGGGWEGIDRGCRSATRRFNSPGTRNYYIGFRLAKSVVLDD